MVWHAKPGCPPHRRDLVEKTVRNMPAEWLEAPCSGDVFEGLIEAERRLRAYAFVEGFDIVRKGGGSKQVPGRRWKCYYHSYETSNSRQLEDHVERDLDGEITSNRQREKTGVRGTGCDWCVSVTFRSIGKRNSGVKGWVLTVKNDAHFGHELGDDPLVFDQHRQGLAEYQAILSTARLHRQAVITYSESRRVLEATADFGIDLTSREYYNSVKKTKGNKEAPETIGGLLIALDNAGFVYRTRVDEELDSFDHIISRKLVQIWFTHPVLLEATARFVSDWLLVVDATFNTNDKRMPIIIAVGVLNTGKTFPIAFSYCPGEDEASFAFFWDSLKAHCFTARDEAGLEPCHPRVILGDQAAAIIASVPKAFPNAIVQSCDWHAVEAMVAKYSKTGYPRAQILGYRTDPKDPATFIKGLKGYSWDYIKSMTEDELLVNKAALIAQLKPEDQEYIRKTWTPKESRVIYLHTKYYANLGATSSQRGESYHEVMRMITHGQLSLEDSATRLCTTVTSIIKNLAISEDMSLKSFPRAAQTYTFTSLRLKITNYAIDKIEGEWRELTRRMSADIELGECHCQLLLRFGLPCMHKLLRAYQTGDPIPRSLVHPRWWLKGPSICSTSWNPTYPLEENDEGQEQRQRGPPTVSIEDQLSSLRRRMNPEEQHRFDRVAAASDQNLLQYAQRLNEQHDLPIGQPDAVPKRRYTKKKTHGRADARGLTAAEIALRDLGKAEAAQRGVERAATTQIASTQGEKLPEREAIFQRTPTPPPLTQPETTPPMPPPSRKRTTTLADRTPEKPRQAPAREPSPSDFLPPSSTAPAQLTRATTRGRTVKKHNYKTIRKEDD